MFCPLRVYVCVCARACCTYSKLLYYRMFSPPLLCPFTPLSLPGGYENFHSHYPELCTEVKTIEPSGTESEKRVSNHAEALSRHKPDYDQVRKQPRSTSSPCPLPRAEYTFMHLPTSAFFQPCLTKNKYKNKKRPNAADRGLYLASKHFPILIFPDLHAPGPSHVRPVMPTSQRCALSSLTFPCLQLHI